MRRMSQYSLSNSFSTFPISTFSTFPTFPGPGIPSNQLPSYLNQLPGCLNLPGSVGIVVNYSLLLDMFDARHVVVPSGLDLPGTVPIAVNHLLQRTHILDALHVVAFVPNLSPNQVPFMLFPSCQSVPALP